MTTSKAVLALCLVGAAVAAPQLRLGGLRSVSSVSSVTNQEEVVTNVVSALGPSIAAAVKEALAAQAAAEASRLEAQRRAAARAAAAAQAAAAAASKANKADDEPAKYNFEYKIADDQAQVYITQTEGRDGNQLTGTYSYVDARGALVTVNYEAGPEGYSETREEELGFVDIRAQPARAAPAPAPVKTDQATLIQKILAILNPQISSAVTSAIQARRAEAARLEAERRAAAQAQAAAAEAARLEAERRAAAQAARLEAERRAAAEAERRAAAEAARREAERRAAEAARIEAERRAAEEAAAAAAAAAASSSNSIDIFGNGGYNVRVQTPDFKIEY